MTCATSTIFSTIRSEARSSGITLTHAASETYRRSALLCVVNVGLLDPFLRFFIREFSHPHFSSRDSDSAQDLALSSEVALRRNGQLYALRSQPRVFLCQSSPCHSHCRRWLTTADNSVFMFVSVFSRVLSCALGCSCAPRKHCAGEHRGTPELPLTPCAQLPSGYQFPRNQQNGPTNQTVESEPRVPPIDLFRTTSETTRPMTRRKKKEPG